MSRSHLSIASLVLLFAVPLSWVACGGGKPAENPENASGDDAAAASSTETPSTEAPASSGASNEPAPAASSEPAPAPASTAAAAPPAPSLGGTDCGKCIDKSCKAQAAACGKNGDCQSMLDSFHGCSSDKGAAACLDGASMPSAAKPKKLAGAYDTCAKKALGKACKASCK